MLNVRLFSEFYVFPTEVIKIAAKKVPVFKAGKGLKDAVK